MTWIRVEQSLRNHPKLRKAAKLLGLSEAEIVGRLMYLWWWAVDYAPDGDLSRYTVEDVELAADWGGEPGAFVEAFCNCGYGKGAGFLERDAEGRLKIHDWQDYAGKLIERRARNAERMRQVRATPVQRTDDAHPEHVQAVCKATDVRTYERNNERTNARTNVVGNDSPPDVTPSERAVLSHLQQITGYPFEYDRDLQLVRLLAVQFPKVDLVETARKWQVYKLDRPLEAKSNPRSQFRTWVRKEQEFMQKRGGKDARKAGAAAGGDKDWFGRFGPDRREEPGDVP